MKVNELYRCQCGREEEYRATDNVADHAHYCRKCVPRHLIGTRHLVAVEGQVRP